MFNLDSRLTQQFAPYLGRVLIVDPTPSAARMLTQLLRGISPGEAWTAATAPEALTLAESTDPQLIFVEYQAADLDGLSLTRQLRRSNFACRMAPLIMTTSQATPAAIIGARDAGVHEFLRKPFTNNDLVKRLDAVTRNPRRWIEAVDYVGPDRRRFNSGDYTGARRRRTDVQDADPVQADIAHALKIIAAAALNLDAAPVQLRRALLAQTEDLQRAAVRTRNIELQAAAFGLKDFLTGLGPTDVLAPEALEPFVQELMVHRPKDADKRPAA